MRSWTRLLIGISISSSASACATPSNAPAASPTHVASSDVDKVAKTVPASPLVDAVSSAPEAQVDLRTMLRGRPTLVVLWATWCEACREEFAALNRLDAVAAEHEGLVVAIAVGDDVQKVRGVVAGQRLRYAQLVDPEFQFSDALGVRRVPTNLVVDRTGRIVHVGGALDAATLAAFRAQLQSAN